MTEYLVENRISGEWSAITIADQSDTALVVTSAGLVLDWTKTTALITLAYVQMTPDHFVVTEVR